MQAPDIATTVINSVSFFAFLIYGIVALIMLIITCVRCSKTPFAVMTHQQAIFLFLLIIILVISTFRLPSLNVGRFIDSILQFVEFGIEKNTTTFYWVDTVSTIAGIVSYYVLVPFLILLFSISM